MQPDEWVVCGTSLCALRRCADGAVLVELCGAVLCGAVLCGAVLCGAVLCVGGAAVRVVSSFSYSGWRSNPIFVSLRFLGASVP
jgi:hypothetical protein